VRRQWRRSYENRRASFDTADDAWPDDSYGRCLLGLFRHASCSPDNSHSTNGYSNIDARACAIGTNHAVYRQDASRRIVDVLNKSRTRRRRTAVRRTNAAVVKYEPCRHRDRSYREGDCHWRGQRVDRSERAWPKGHAQHSSDIRHGGPHRNRIVSDTAMTATGWCDGLRTTIALVFTRPQPSVTPGTGPALKYSRSVR
jgi:hypothetical protein